METLSLSVAAVLTAGILLQCWATWPGRPDWWTIKPVRYFVMVCLAAMWGLTWLYWTTNFRLSDLI